MGLAAKTTGRAAEPRRRTFYPAPQSAALAPAFETSRARGLFWRLARAGPIWPAQAFAAIAETLPLGSVAIEPERAPDGSVGVWLDHATLAKLNH
jgi:hypothetical protein